MSRLALAALAILLIAAPVAAADDSREAWAALVNGSHVALVRHGNAPPGYGGDPPGFKIDDCATQRNMDERGRAQARAVGEAFRQHGVIVDKVLSSPWCRCLETARLMALGPVEDTWAVAASDRSADRLVVLQWLPREPGLRGSARDARRGAFPDEEAPAITPRSSRYAWSFAALASGSARAT